MEYVSGAVPPSFGRFVDEDWVLERAHSTAFISYSPDDRPFVLDLVEELGDDDRVLFFQNPELTTSIEAWRRDLADVVAESDAFVFVLSAKALKSQVCRRHLECAEELGKIILTVVREELNAERVPDKNR